MDIGSYTDKILQMRRSENGVSKEAFQLIETALKHFPRSASLHCIKGDSIQLASEDWPYNIEDALRCYEKAIEIDPKCSEAFESIGYYFDVIDLDLKRSEQAFKSAIDIEDRVDSYVGLARVMSERGVAVRVVVEFLKSCPFWGSEKIAEIHDEVVEGIWLPE